MGTSGPVSPEEWNELLAQWNAREARVAPKRTRIWWLIAAAIIAVAYVASLFASLLGGALLAMILLVIAWQLVGWRERVAAIREIPGLADAEWRWSRFFW